MKMLLLLILMTAVTLQPLKYGNLMVIYTYIYICTLESEVGKGSQKVSNPTST